MNINNQKADQIYNVGRDLNITGNLNIAGDLNLNTTPEVFDSINKDKQRTLSELYSISYYSNIKKELSNKILIERPQELDWLIEVLRHSSQILLYGPPGIGKTTFITQALEEVDDVIYVSLKNKSPLNVYAYLVNKIRLKNGSELQEITSVDNAVNWLQCSLQESSQHIVIDDCEQDPDTALKLMALEKYNTHFLFATRSKSPFEVLPIAVYQCKPFSKEEIKEFLEKIGFPFGQLNLYELQKKSCGNPLYLFYFSQYQVSPLPACLSDYQRSIWNQLRESQQELLSLLAISYSSINVSDILETTAIGSTPMEVVREINNLSSLVSNESGVLEIFHPSFKEFIIEYLSNTGVLELYKSKLGEYFLRQERVIDAVYLLIDIAPSKVDHLLYDILPYLFKWGELHFALKVLLTKLKSVDKDIDKGYLNFLLCNVHYLLGNKRKATACIDSALEFLKKTDTGLYNLAQLHKAMDLILHGNPKEALQIADKVQESVRNNCKLKAALLVGLSKLYIDLSNFEKGASVCKEAYKIFEAENDITGMVGSLLNLVCCLTNIKGYIDLAESYGLALLNKVRDNSDFLGEAIVLNSLTSIFRQKEDYDKAEEYCLKCIELCQLHSMKDKVVLNLMNYANVIRDKGDLETAVTLYNEALSKAEEYKLQHEKGRVCYLLSEVYRSQSNLELSFEFAEKSEKIYMQLKDDFRLAEALRTKAEALLEMKKELDAAVTFVSSAEFYGKIPQYVGYQHFYHYKAISIYSQLGKSEDAHLALGDFIQVAINNSNFSYVIDSIKSVAKDDDNVAPHLCILFEEYLSKENSGSESYELLSGFIAYCMELNECSGRKMFLTVINVAIDNLRIGNQSFFIVGVLVDKSKNFFNKTDMNYISERLESRLPTFFVRNMGDEKIIVTSVQSKINLEIRLFSDDLVCYKLAYLLILIINESPSLIIEDEAFTEQYSKLQFLLYSSEFAESLGPELPTKEELFSGSIHTAHFEKKDYNIPDIILVNPKYGDLNVLNDGSEDWGTIYFLWSAIMRIKSHLYHSEIKKNKVHRRFLLDSVADLFGYVHVEDSAIQPFAGFEVDTDKLFQ